jgi:hypothetical protein
VPAAQFAGAVFPQAWQSSRLEAIHAAPDLNRCGLPVATAVARSCGCKPPFPLQRCFRLILDQHLKGWVQLSIARDRRADYLAAVTKPAGANDSNHLSAAGHTPVTCP